MNKRKVRWLKWNIKKVRGSVLHFSQINLTEAKLVVCSLGFKMKNSSTNHNGFLLTLKKEEEEEEEEEKIFNLFPLNVEKGK